MSYGVPVKWGTWQITVLEVNGQRMTSPDWTPGTWYVSPDYFRVMGIPVLKGREFTEKDVGSGVRAVVVSKALAEKLWPGQDPIGKRLDVLEPRADLLETLRKSPELGLRLGGDPSDWVKKGASWEVVGEVGYVRMLGVDDHEEPLAMYADYRDGRGSAVLSEKFVVRTIGDPVMAATAAKAQVVAANGMVAVSEITTMREVIKGSIGGRGSNELLLLVSTVFGTLALLLDATGIYGALSHWTTQRTHEIGVRVALGARTGDVLGTVLGKGMWLVIAGVLFGVAGALVTTRLLSAYLFHVSPSAPMTLIAVSALLLVIAMGACYLPARRATEVDPMIALRWE
jgi:putative ABC transport system permease protein